MSEKETGGGSYSITWGEILCQVNLHTLSPQFLVVWDPKTVTEQEYADLLKTIGDLVRAEGGSGLQRIRSQGVGVSAEEGATL